MKHITQFKIFENKTRTIPLTEEEFLDIIKKNCTQFNFKNDMLYRGCGEIGEYALYKEAERKGTYGGGYSYKDFFDQRKDYPVPRYKSIIGSTSPIHAGVFGQVNDSVYLVIPFDNSKIIICPKVDMASGDLNAKTIWSDDMFQMKEYSSDFKVNGHFEFFTNANCLLYRLGAGAHRSSSYPSIPKLVDSGYKLNRLVLKESMDRLKDLINS